MTTTPTPDEIRARRLAIGLTQTEAAELIYSRMRSWQNWEAGERTMHPGLWELFCLKSATANPATSAANAP
ncbi:DNA-binding transcriptional regulator [Acetobacter sp. DsW_063]|uniref:helix-turn-helix domain-containing protein n=1 Tax=Acetobacter sp. DsW_063 TaxID=1514894 RepID=UPI000A37C7CA|nr:helix-turn-helix domain-containing protein [Acetobacter sp. DsW_063]